MSQQDLEKLVEADVGKYPLGGEPGSQSQEQFWRGMGVNIQRKDETAEGTEKPELATGSKSSLETLLGVNTQESAMRVCPRLWCRAQIGCDSLRARA